MWDEVMCSKNLSDGEYPAILRIHYYGQTLDSATIHEAGNSQESVILSPDELLALTFALIELRGELNDDGEADTDK